MTCLLRCLSRKAVAVARVDLAQVDVQPHQIAALARDEQDVALVGRLDRGLEPDVREVGDGQHVHHAPGVVGEVAARHGADRLAHAAARAVAADDVPGAHASSRAPSATSRSVTTHRVLAVGFDRQRHELQAVVGLRAASATGACSRAGTRCRRAWLTMTCGNSDRPSSMSWTRPVRTMRERSCLRRAARTRSRSPSRPRATSFVAQAEGLEHLDRAAGDAVGLAELERAVAALDEPRA